MGLGLRRGGAALDLALTWAPNSTQTALAEVLFFRECGNTLSSCDGVLAGGLGNEISLKSAIAQGEGFSYNTKELGYECEFEAFLALKLTTLSTE
jgi:hypothetical protein